MITVSLNGESTTVQENSSLNDLLVEAKISLKGIAVAVNQNIVSKQQWGATTLVDQDQLLIIKATQGG